KPAIRSPRQRIRNGMRILHPKTGQQNFRSAIGHVITVAVRIKQEVRRLQDEHSVITERHARAQVQAADKIFELMGPPLRIEVFADSYAICALWSAWRGLGRPIVLGAQ